VRRFDVDAVSTINSTRLIERLKLVPVFYDGANDE
jgi:hypothetical protein